MLRALRPVDEASAPTLDDFVQRGVTAAAFTGPGAIAPVRALVDARVVLGTAEGLVAFVTALRVTLDDIVSAGGSHALSMGVLARAFGGAGSVRAALAQPPLSVNVAKTLLEAPYVTRLRPSDWAVLGTRELLAGAAGGKRRARIGKDNARLMLAAAPPDAWAKAGFTSDDLTCLEWALGRTLTQVGKTLGWPAGEAERSFATCNK